MKKHFWILVAVAVGVLLFPIHTNARLCDVDADGDVDRADVQAVTSARNTPAAGFDDPRDANGDGIINVNDARACVVQCDLPRCASPAANTLPVADAGPAQQSLAGATVQLDGRGSSDADGDPLGFAWSLLQAPAGSVAMLNDAATSQASITVDLPGVYSISLVVNDGIGDSAPSLVEIQVAAPVISFDNSVFAEQSVPPSGGSVSLEDPTGSRYLLEFESGTLAEETQITATRVAAIDGFPLGLEPIAAVRMQPSGLVFQNSAALTVELPAGVRSGKPALGFLIDDNGQNLRFTPLSGSTPAKALLEDLVVTLSIPHFTAGGVLEAGADAVLPPPPPSADAQERAEHDISRRIAELENNGGGVTDDDPEILQLLEDWFNNAADGLSARARALAIAPEADNLASLHELTGEMSAFVEKINDWARSPGGDALKDAVVNEMSNLAASYLATLKDMCSDDSSAAQQRLSILEVEIVGAFLLSELEEAFENESFACEYDVMFMPDFKAAFFGDLVGFDYVITAEDGSIFGGALNELPVDITFIGNGIDIIDSSVINTVTVRSLTLGLGTSTIEIGEREAGSAELLAIPTFVGGYGVSAVGSAAGCSDPEDAGNGSVNLGLSINSEQILAANRDSAVVGLSGSGGIVTGLALTVNLMQIDPQLGASGVVQFGSASYRTTEVDEVDPSIIYVTVGGGSLSGSVTSTQNGNTFDLDFAGGDNFCSDVSGTVFMASP